jgi:hypothetical protein
MLVHEWITVAYGGNWEDAGRKKPRLSELLITAATATFITHPADAASRSKSNIGLKRHRLVPSRDDCARRDRSKTQSDCLAGRTSNDLLNL